MTPILSPTTVPGQDPLATVAVILGVMALVALLEALEPLHARGVWNRAHLWPNLALTTLTFVTNVVFNGALISALAMMEHRGLGLLAMLALPPVGTAVIAVLLLDLSFYVCHVAMHRLPVLWRFHQIHHSDPAVDVTTTIRQHPGEGAIRYAFLAAFALPLGVGLHAFAFYRVASAVSGLLEHANLKIPRALDDLLALVVTWPGFHKVHHSRDARYTDTNYGNLLSWWDLAFGTRTAAHHGATIAYGLAGLDDAATQSTTGLLRLPFRAATDSVTDVRPARAAERC